MKRNTEYRKVGDVEVTEMFPGVHRTTLCYNDDIMLCHFTIKKGAKIPLHHHVAAQNGYVVSGSVRFFREDGTDFVATAGTGYLFNSDEPHGLDGIDDTVLIECFTPVRPEYADK